MNRGFRVGALLAATLLAVVVGVASYNAGVSHGLAVAAPAAAAAAQGQAPAPGVPGVPYYPYYYGWHRPWGFGFFPFGFLMIFFWIALFRLAFGWGWRRRYYGGGPYCGSYGGPAGFDEWHRRAHEQMAGQPPAQSRTTV